MCVARGGAARQCSLRTWTLTCASFPGLPQTQINYCPHRKPGNEAKPNHVCLYYSMDKMDSAEQEVIKIGRQLEKIANSDTPVR